MMLVNLNNFPIIEKKVHSEKHERRVSKTFFSKFILVSFLRFQNPSTITNFFFLLSFDAVILILRVEHEVSEQEVCTFQFVQIK